MADTPIIYRVIVEVSDLHKAQQFYSQLLNIEGRVVGGGRCYFDCGPVILAILDAQQKPKAIPQYIYFSVEALETIYARAKTLSCLSQEMLHGSPAGEMIVRPWGERSFYAYDPDGNGLCFVAAESIFTGL
jgi:hypothetical protein